MIKDEATVCDANEITINPSIFKTRNDSTENEIQCPIWLNQVLIGQNLFENTDELDKIY